MHRERILLAGSYVLLYRQQALQVEKNESVLTIVNVIIEYTRKRDMRDRLMIA